MLAADFFLEGHEIFSEHASLLGGVTPTGFGPIGLIPGGHKFHPGNV